MSQQIGDTCTRCDGTGQVYDEVFEYEWTVCPYFDVDTGVACLNGKIVSIDEAMPPTVTKRNETPPSCHRISYP